MDNGKKRKFSKQKMAFFAEAIPGILASLLGGAITSGQGHPVGPDIEAHCAHCQKRTRMRPYGIERTRDETRFYHVGKCCQCGKRVAKAIPKKQMREAVQHLKDHKEHYVKQFGGGILSAIGLPIPQFLKNIPILGSLLF